MADDANVVAADAATLQSLLSEVKNDNAAGEYYLPDIVEIARARGLSAGVVHCAEAETLGVNSRAELAGAEASFQQAIRARLMADGVTLQAPDTCWFAWDTVIGRDAEIEPNVIFGPGVTIESGARIRAFSHLEVCHVSRGAWVCTAHETSSSTCSASAKRRSAVESYTIFCRACSSRRCTPEVTRS